MLIGSFRFYFSVGNRKLLKFFELRSNVIGVVFLKIFFDNSVWDKLEVSEKSKEVIVLIFVNYKDLNYGVVMLIMRKRLILELFMK